MEMKYIWELPRCQIKALTGLKVHQLVSKVWIIMGLKDRNTHFHHLARSLENSHRMKFPLKFFCQKRLSLLAERALLSAKI